jgi:hypothetical protein
MSIGTQPPPSVGYETPTHLLPFKTAICAELFRPGPIRDFPLHLIPPRDQYPFYYDQLHDYNAQRTAAEKSLSTISLHRATDEMSLDPHSNINADERQLLTLVNDLNRAMFTTLYQSLEQPPVRPRCPARLDATTPNPRGLSLNETMLAINDNSSATGRQPERLPRYYVQRRPITTAVDMAVNSNAPTPTINTAVAPTSNRGAVNNDAMRHARPTTATPLMTDAAPNAKSRISAHIKNVSDGYDDQQNE